MAMTPEDVRIAGRELGRQMFQLPNKPATMNLDDLAAAISSIDATMDLLPPGMTGTQTVKQNFATRLPEPFKTLATPEEKAIAIGVWALKETGKI